MSAVRSRCPLFFSLVSLLVLDLCAANHTTCEIQAEYPTEKASLKCNFTENLLQTETGICVKHYRDFNDTEGEIVVECFWIPSHAEHHCHAKTKDGYNYSIESNILTMVIQNATAKHEGRYQCRIICDKSDGARECQFMLPTVSGEKQQSSKYETVIIPVIGSLLAVLILVVVVVLVIVYRRRIVSHRCKRCADPGTAETVPMRTLENNESNLSNGTAGAFATGSAEDNAGNPSNQSNGTELASS